MLKYFAVAGALKIFSCSGPTRKLYRFLGNTVGARKRSQRGLPELYRDRAKRIPGVFEKYGIPEKGARALELGTGWLHWESTVLRLFYDARFTLFDVWDCRQFPAFRAYFSEFRNVLDNEMNIDPAKHQWARELLDKILAVGSFGELYDLLGFEYVVEPTGTLRTLDSDAYDVCFSCNVFEHIDRRIIAEYIVDLYHRLKPGGYSFQTIDMTDHLAHYDPGVCEKNYLRYSDAVWKLFFENPLQYFNRIQRSEWLSLFDQAGFELVEEESLTEPLPAGINRKCKDMDRQDAECKTLHVVHRRPF